MNYREFFDDIKKRKLDKLYLFCGEEEYIKKIALDRVVETFVDKKLKDLNYQVIDGANVDVNVIINACETLPFMAEKRVVVIKDLFLFQRGSTQQEKNLEAYLGRIPDTTCLIFYVHGEVDKRKKIVKTIGRFGKIVTFEQLKGAQLEKWIIKTLKKHKKQMSRADIRYFISMVGNRLDFVNNELLKLISYAQDELVITREVIDKITNPVLEHSIFELVDAVGEKKRQKALILLDRLIFTGYPPLVILAMLERQFRLILQCKLFQDEGCPKELIAQKLKVSHYVVRMCLKQGRNFSVTQLKQAISMCLDIDYGMKSGRVRAHTGIEMLIIKMCT